MNTPQPITKGVIAVAGSGTRFLPVTKSLPKEMLPIIDKPIVHYVVEEMVSAGIRDIIMVTRSDKKILEDYFDRNILLEMELGRRGKDDLLEDIERITQKANFIYIRQKGYYGNGTPVLNASSIVGNEPFVFAYGDDLVKLNNHRSAAALAKPSFTRQLLDKHHETGAVVIGCQEVSDEEVRHYGVVKLKDDSPEKQVIDIVEKPEPRDAPSRLAVFGRFVLVPEICEILRELPLGKNGELWLTDAIEQYIKRGSSVVAQPIQDGRWYTTGDPLHLLKAIVEYAKDRNEYWPDFHQYLTSVLSINPPA